MDCDNGNVEDSFRSRSNTWPRLQPTVPEQDTPKKPPFGRRNIWGIHSYADLIARAIISSPTQKMTLSQIYVWMLENVPIFKNRSENSDSWKNSVRHNLSLHSQFVRIPNGETGKGSWWALDPEAKQTKLGRRRSSTMESGTMEARRQRADRSVKSTTLIANSVTNPENLEPYQTLPTAINPAFRPRTFSNSSGSHLSSIPSGEASPSWVNTTLETRFQTYPYPAYQLNSAFRPRAHSSGSSSSDFQAPPFHPYQCQFVRPRTYSSGSSSGKVPPEYAEWSSSGGTPDLGYEGLANNFQSGLNMDPQPVEEFHVESYMVPSTVNGDIDMGCQYTINVPKWRDLGVWRYRRWSR
ncbi:hypothetical protein JTB14_030628 [Gonioctena quinquepunctata]|nr:hypothetical protein JTB14_030628 [Gonioctena quinquepunctata]